MTKKQKVNIENTFKEHRILLQELTVLTPEEQYSTFKSVLDIMYENQVEETSDYVINAVNLMNSTTEEKTELPYDLVIIKNDEALIFKFEKTKSPLPLFLLFGFILIVALLTATYFGMLYLNADDDQQVDVDGNQNSSIHSGHLNIVYEEVGELVYNNLVPDDHGDVYYPEKKFTITNLSDFDVAYKLTFIVDSNTFTSENFQYNLVSDNNGYNSDGFEVAPWEDTVLEEVVMIPALTTQTYTMTFKLQGTNEPQNYDQGKSFDGWIKVGE